MTTIDRLFRVAFWLAVTLLVAGTITVSGLKMIQRVLGDARQGMAYLMPTED